MLLSIATFLVASSCVSSVTADEGFFSRFNPFRSRSTAKAQPTTTQSPQPIVATQFQGLSTDHLRSQMAAQGLDQATIDSRIAQMEQRRVTGDLQGPDQPRPSIDDLRARMTQQGVDQATIDSRISQMEQQREAGGTRTAGQARPSIDEMRTRMPENGVDQSTINSQIVKMSDRQANPSLRQEGSGGFDRSGTQGFGGTQGSRPEGSGTRSGFGGGMRRGGR